MYQNLIATLVLLASAFNAHTKDSVDMMIVTEASSFACLENNVVKGVGTDLVKEVMATAKLTYSINLYPWARSYRYATTQPNTLIYALSRTKDREHRFHWVGKILALNYKFYRLRSRPDVVADQLTDLKHYIVSANRGGIISHYLQQQSFAKLAYAGGIEQELKLLLAHRSDLIVLSENSLVKNLASLNIDPHLLVPILDIPEISTTSYIALSQQTAPAIVKRVQQAYQQVVQDGRYQEIMAPRL